MKQSADVLDTWFSSALWPFATLGWPSPAHFRAKASADAKALADGSAGKAKKNKSDLERFYPTDVLSTDRGIINLWVARMIFSGMEFMKKEPFRDVYIHATVLTREGKRMSKSLGTGIDPLELIEKYGADATRFGIAWQITELQDIKFVEDNIVMGKKFCNKIWNATRFILMNKPARIYADSGSPHSQRGFTRMKNLTPADKKILDSLAKVTKNVNADLGGYRFGRAAQRLYHFFWHDFCDKYIEIAKLQITNSPPASPDGSASGGRGKSRTEKENTQKILLHVLLTSLKLLYPFIPFVTEKIYQQLPLKNKKKFLMVEGWPK